MQNFSCVFPTPIGKVGLGFIEQQLTQLTFLPADSSPKIAQSSFEKNVQAQILAYFEQPHAFSKLDITLAGSLFQQRVWDLLKTIPIGETRTYGELAQSLQTSPRAIGQACRTNPVAIVVPCHRVVARHHLGGFSGELGGKMLDIKKFLLRHEQQI